MNMPEESRMQRCIEACLECRRVCFQMAMTHCLKEGGAHVEQAHLSLMMNCASLCQTAADFMLAESALHAEVCRVCADVCAACAQSCARLAGMEDCERACRKWNHTIKKTGLDHELFIPSRRFNRSMGVYSTAAFSPTGEPISRETFEANRARWLPTAEDRAYVISLMHPVHEQGKIANWIAPPKQGVDGKPFDWEYVRFHG